MPVIRAVNIGTKPSFVHDERSGFKPENRPVSDISRRRFAIGDIHGCSRTLRKMVEQVLLLKPEDTLYLLGDYIDRGPDSIGVLDYLMHLRASGFDIQALMGNHEEMLINALDDPSAAITWYVNGGWRTIQEFKVDSPEDIPQPYLDFITGLPRILITEDYVLVHAGLDFSTRHPLRDTSGQFMLWTRDNRVDSVKLDGRTLITGHTVTSLSDIRKSLSTNHINLDNGCYARGETGYGALVALDLDARELLVQKNIE